MKTKYLVSGIFTSFAFFGLLFLNTVYAQEQAGNVNIQYPIAELGNCSSKTACATYCDKSKNTELCINFAEKNNMMSQEEIKVAKNFVATGNKGPGGCTSKDSCETYCNDISHIDECVSFAEKNNLMPPAELAEAKKVQAAIARGIKPPACGNKKQCDAYCEDSSHMEECISFASEAGFMQGKELEDAKKMLAAIKRGVKPPPCKGKEACDQYCSVPENLEACMNFASEAGFMSDEEKANSQKMLQAVKKGIKPPRCKGKEECDAYCGQEEHFEECVSFAEAAGFMSSKDAIMARKTGGKGPGGCKGKEECETFCNNPDNQETCFNFAKENGTIPEEDLKKMEEAKQGMKKALEQAPSAAIDCLVSELGADAVEKLKNGEGAPSKDIGDKMKVCFEKSGPQQGEPGKGGQAPMPKQPGPGGCTSPEECNAYCQSNPEECQKFQPGPGAVNPGEQMMPQQSGPGGCKSPEECKIYCTTNPEICQNFQPGVPPPQGQPSFSPPPQGYPMPSQMQPPPCTGESCPSAPLPGQPVDGNNFSPSPQPLNSPGSFETPPTYTEPPTYQQPEQPTEQQPITQPSPENSPSITSFNRINLVGAVLQIFSLLFN